MDTLLIALIAGILWGVCMLDLASTNDSPAAYNDDSWKAGKD